MKIYFLLKISEELLFFLNEKEHIKNTEILCIPSHATESDHNLSR